MFVLVCGECELGNLALQLRWSSMMKGVLVCIFSHYFYIILQLAAGCFDHYFFMQQEKLCPGVGLLKYVTLLYLNSEMAFLSFKKSPGKNLWLKM